MKKVSPYTMAGTFEGSMKFGARYYFEKQIEDTMRLAGRVPVYDLDTEWFIYYNPESDTYDFELVMYSVYVGPVKAQTEVLGYTEADQQIKLFEDETRN